VDTNDTAEGQAHNRRVEVIISGRNLEEEGLTGTVEQYITQPEAAQSTVSFRGSVSHTAQPFRRSCFRAAESQSAVSARRAG
jgi:hypothetical protein